ncbi:hypothetical protein MMC07_006469 [Pseudocyphellaria aurata]|nr:hypothetical protein [Pseudocyphellaria aurata]
MSLAGKVSLSTGASRGIGGATALHLARGGATIAVNYASDASSAREIVEQIGLDTALAIQADAGKVAAVTNMLSRPLPNSVKLTFSSPAQIFALDVKGLYFLTQNTAPRMASGSDIVFVLVSLVVTSAMTSPHLPYLVIEGAIE